MKHVSLSASHADWVEAQAARGSYASADAYVAALIDAAARGGERLDVLLREGLESPSMPWDGTTKQDLRRAASNRP